MNEINQPLLVLAAVERIQRKAARRAAPRVVTARSALLLAIVIVGAILFWRATSDATAWISEITFGQVIAGLFATMLLIVVLVDRARRGLRAAHAASWLASMPVCDVALARHHRGIIGRRAIIAACVLLTALTTLLFREDVHASLIALVDCVVFGAMALAAAFGWWLGGRDASRRARRRIARIPHAVRGSGFGALAGWPTARLRERCSGERMSRLVAPVLVLMPAGISGGLALAMIAFWVVLLIAWEMWFALRDIMPRAAAWLSATPLSAPRFAWAMVQRALGVWLCISGLFVAACAVIGMPMRGALTGAVLLVAVGIFGAALMLVQRKHPLLIDGAALMQVTAVAVAAVFGAWPAVGVLLAFAAVNLWRAIAIEADGFINALRMRRRGASP